MTYFDFTDFTKFPIKTYSSITTSGGKKITFPTTIHNGLKQSPVYYPAAGFAKDKITAEIKNGDTLHIRGETNKYDYLVLDVSYVIPDNIDKDSIEISVNDGMITITFDEKREEAKKIKVK
jgi:HSP20 family molecular chaperone IbpA